MYICISYSPSSRASKRMHGQHPAPLHAVERSPLIAIKEKNPGLHASRAETNSSLASVALRLATACSSRAISDNAARNLHARTCAGDDESFSPSTTCNGRFASDDWKHIRVPASPHAALRALHHACDTELLRNRHPSGFVEGYSADCDVQETCLFDGGDSRCAPLSERCASGVGHWATIGASVALYPPNHLRFVRLPAFGLPYIRASVSATEPTPGRNQACSPGGRMSMSGFIHLKDETPRIFEGNFSRKTTHQDNLDPAISESGGHNVDIAVRARKKHSCLSWLETY
ncbi:uncharacterized protein LAESUDRAFT_748459 [Laetiporus sulphureus 93-53]|uniref:Uncharacterized protein n=1 Tax=Laetiporus sulphureus 93-53 TaxID=1314785 RepID=A0A165FPS1_9APHY|nr:uncharacterized protein LAESUDRAFT_748459 [Laetiporus sulphureus 93-53]KZT09291.1 hypothetical protein LAESUDRAFT_748459 [Laetiporus sulphureus 93-53]